MFSASKVSGVLKNAAQREKTQFVSQTEENAKLAKWKQKEA